MSHQEIDAVSHQEITNLIHRYAELVDAGDFAGVGQLFRDAHYGAGGGSVRGAAAVEHLMRDMVLTYEDGTPRTHHVTSNAIIELDEAAGTATSRSYFTVFQRADGRLEAIVAGRYHDAFVRVGAGWRFSERRVLVDHSGDLSRHLRVVPAGLAPRGESPAERGSDRGDASG